MRLDKHVRLPDLSNVKVGDRVYVQPETAPEPLEVVVTEVTLDEIHLDRETHAPDEAAGYIIPRVWPDGHPRERLERAAIAFAACYEGPHDADAYKRAVQAWMDACFAFYHATRAPGPSTVPTSVFDLEEG